MSHPGCLKTGSLFHGMLGNPNITGLCITSPNKLIPETTTVWGPFFTAHGDFWQKDLGGLSA